MKKLLAVAAIGLSLIVTNAEAIEFGEAIKTMLPDAGQDLDFALGNAIKESNWQNGISEFNGGYGRSGWVSISVNGVYPGQLRSDIERTNWNVELYRGQGVMSILQVMYLFPAFIDGTQCDGPAGYNCNLDVLPSVVAAGFKLGKPYHCDNTALRSIDVYTLEHKGKAVSEMATIRSHDLVHGTEKIMISTNMMNPEGACEMAKVI